VFDEATRRWFDDNFASPTDVQAKGWEPLG